MLFLLVSGRRSVSGRAADSSIQLIQWFRSGPRGPLRSDRVAKGEKKPPGSPAVFSGISVALHAPSTLSIRQRSEMPKKVKIKLGGHDGDSVRQKS
ncbi:MULTISPECIES: hypothetical protein [unclassified Burkholderia]|uniref:hypothetical protein n=1 Tax=unclassified Burkholderia TaxID=2613784 RepID=UPI001624C07C|nr:MULTISPECIES: hypothetical protein [unclassified Burkholderia]